MICPLFDFLQSSNKKRLHELCSKIEFTRKFSYNVEIGQEDYKPYLRALCY